MQHKIRKNEKTTFNEVRQADVILFLIPANGSVSGEDMALYQELAGMNKIVEIVISKSDYKTQDEIKAFVCEIQDIFQTKQEMREVELGDTEDLYQYTQLIKKGKFGKEICRILYF